MTLELDMFSEELKKYRIIPIKLVLISSGERNDISLETQNLNFHSLDMESIQKMSGRGEIAIAMPDICKILEIRGITGNLVHKAILKTTYPKIKIMEISTVLHQFTFNEDPTILVKKITDHEVKIICFDKIPAPQGRLREQLYAWIGFCIILTIFLLFMYYLFARVTSML